jgi:NADH-quinone oxidoreductase subunit I
MLRLDQVQHRAHHVGHKGMNDGGNHDHDDWISNRNKRDGQQHLDLGRQFSEVGSHNMLLKRIRKRPYGSSTGIFERHSDGKVALGNAQWYAYPVMGIPSVLRKVFLIDLLQGLRVTFRYQDPKEIYTEQYPMERPQVAERYRGAPRLNVNPDTDETMCIACDLCAVACPENLIVVSSARNEQTRRKELTTFTYDLSRCMFCGLCEDACPVDALELTQDFELASYTREGWIWDRETLEKGPQPTLYKK